MRIFIRLSAINVIAVFIISFIIPRSIYFPKNQMTIFEWLFVGWLLLSLFSSFLLWICLFYHWGMSSFSDRRHKILWFLVLLFGSPIYFIGPFLYYIVVYEMRGGLKIEKPCKQS